MYYDIWFILMVLVVVALICNLFVAFADSWKNNIANALLTLNVIQIVVLLVFMATGKVY